MAKWNFGTSIEELEAKERPPSLNEPYLGPARLLDVRRDEDFAGKGFDVMLFEFELLGEGHKGQRHTHIEWSPKETDSESKVENLHLRLFTIAKYFCKPEAVEKAMNVQTDDVDVLWDKMTKNIQTLFDKYLKDEYKTTKDKDDLQIKVVGSVYDTQDGERKSKLAFTNYLGFMSDSESASAVTFSNKEKESNAEYLEFRNAEPDEEEVFEEEEFESDDSVEDEPEEDAEDFF